MREGNTVCDGRHGHGVVRGGEASGLAGEDSSHGRIPGDDFLWSCSVHYSSHQLHVAVKLI